MIDHKSTYVRNRYADGRGDRRGSRPGAATLQNASNILRLTAVLRFDYANFGLRLESTESLAPKC